MRAERYANRAFTKHLMSSISFALGTFGQRNLFLLPIQMGYYVGIARGLQRQFQDDLMAKFGSLANATSSARPLPRVFGKSR